MSTRVRRPLSLPSDIHARFHPMAFSNDSFICAAEDERLTGLEINRTEDEIPKSCNDVDGWNMEEIFTYYKRTRSKSETQVNENNLVFGAEIVLQLPEKYSELDKIVLTKNRNSRRNAVHISDNRKLKKLLKQYISMKHTMNYEIITI